MRALCAGDVAVAFLGSRAAASALHQKPAGCAIDIRVVNVPASTIQLGVGSTFEAAGAADHLRREINNLFRDGSLAEIMAKYTYYGLDDTWTTYSLMEAENRARLMAWGIAVLVLALGLTLWQAHSLRIARQAAERANAASSLSLSRYQLVARATNDALFEYDFGTRTVLWNEAVQALFGYTVDAVGSDNTWWEQRIHPDDRERVLAGLQSAIAYRASTWSDEYRFRCADDSYASVVDRGHLLYEGDKPARMVRAIMDITARRKLEEELRYSQKMEAVGRLAGGIAHDFNNLLTIILGYGSLLKQSLQFNEQAEDHIRVVMGAAGQAARLTQQLLAFSRKQVLRPEVINLNDVIGEMEKILRGVVREDTELIITLAPDLGRVRADRGQIEQVVMNLCVNARDAMPRGGRLTLETGNIDLAQERAAHNGPVKPGPYALLAISDTGCGMDAETRARIFEPFFTTKEFGKGTGLGLSTCHGIVKQSGGDVLVYSEPGKGSRFEVYLPRTVETQSAPRPELARGANGD
jgi:PAS domain S-box-containing protein